MAERTSYAALDAAHGHFQRRLRRNATRWSGSAPLSRRRNLLLARLAQRAQLIVVEVVCQEFFQQRRRLGRFCRRQQMGLPVQKLPVLRLLAEPRLDHAQRLFGLPLRDHAVQALQKLFGIFLLGHQPHEDASRLFNLAVAGEQRGEAILGLGPRRQLGKLLLILHRGGQVGLGFGQLRKLQKQAPCRACSR